MKNDKISRLIVSILLPIGLCGCYYIFSNWPTFDESFRHQWSAMINYKSTPSDLKEVDKKQRGAHVFGYLDSVNLQPLIQNNFDWITLVSYGAQEDVDSPTMVYYRGDSLEMTRRDSMWKSQIELAHSAGFKVFLKPHVWLTNPTNGRWRSDIFPSNENNWQLWQKNYREFILLYAKIAQKNKVELFCIGTEFSRLSVEKTDFWKKLIQEVRTIYKGKITYAANWYQEFENITFWEGLDYIGIQAYFPLVKNQYPSVQQIAKGWNKHIPAMTTVYKKNNRPILFTEMGYKSTPDSAIEPWQWIEYEADEDPPVSLETQANCYEAFFKTVWKQEWFAGVHIWQLRSDFVPNRGKNNLDFTPQGKPAATIIANGFE